MRSRETRSILRPLITRPCRSKRAMISPTRLRCTPSGLIITSVCSMILKQYRMEYLFITHCCNSVDKPARCQSCQLHHHARSPVDVEYLVNGLPAFRCMNHALAAPVGHCDAIADCGEIRVPADLSHARYEVRGIADPSSPRPLNGDVSSREARAQRTCVGSRKLSRIC